MPVIMEEFGIHPNNFALARAIAGDPSDNLKGVPRVGLKTVSKKFEFLSSESEVELETVLEHCSNIEKQLQVHKNILSHKQLIENNYKIMQLYFPNIRPLNRQLITKAVNDFEPFFDKIKFTQMLFDDDAGHLNFDALQYILRNIKR